MAMDEEVAERQHLHDRMRDELNAAQIADSQVLDRALLTLSSGFLAFSLAFFKDVAPPSKLLNMDLLWWSWWLFAITILLVLTIIVAMQFIRRWMINSLHDAYGDDPEIRENVEKRYTRIVSCTAWVNTVPMLVFIIAVVLTVGFVIANT